MDLKRGTPVTVHFEGKMVSRPHKDVARVSLRATYDGKPCTFWAVVPISSIQSTEDGTDERTR